ncbi:MAG TPA: c-type cytochrome [Terriglobales bacterium]|nr:c-type cytochrome [Terriglobales bacterium]
MPGLVPPRIDPAMEMLSRRDRQRPLTLLWRILAAVVLLCGCNYFRDFDFARGARLTGGDPQVGRKKVADHSCISCHIIPGVPNSTGTLAPGLASWSRQREIAGTIPNTPANLEQWIQSPARLKPGTTMPDMNVSAEDSRDIAAYLFSLN